MATPTEAATKAVQRVRDLHQGGPDGACAECGKAWPCPTIHAVDGPAENDITQALNELRTVLATAEQQPPADITALRKRVRQAIGDPVPTPPPVQPPPPPPPPEPPVHVGTGR